MSINRSQSDLTRRVREWDGDPDLFAALLLEAVGPLGNLRPALTSQLAEECETGLGYPGMWARGVIMPTPGTQKKILDAVRRHLENQE